LGDGESAARAHALNDAYLAASMRETTVWAIRTGRLVPPLQPQPRLPRRRVPRTAPRPRSRRTRPRSSRGPPSGDDDPDPAGVLAHRRVSRARPSAGSVFEEESAVFAPPHGREGER
jgi:hypothetical protein